MWRYFKWVGVVLLLVMVVALSGLYVATQPTPIPAFYQTPKIESTWLAGRLIRQQAVTDDLPQHAQAWRMLYVSTNSTQQKIALSAMVIAPVAQSMTPRPILLWAHGSVGVLPHCAVSHTRHPHQQTPALQEMIDRGWVVVVPDYQGLGTAGVHSYLLGEPSSRALWDAVKATTQLPLFVGQRVMIWGASQGGQAALWAAERASVDAPTFEVVATAVSAPAIDLAGIIQAKQDDQGGGVFVAQALYAWSHHIPKADLDQIIQPSRRAQFERMATTCISTPLAFLTIGKLLTPKQYLTTDLNTTEPWRSILHDHQPKTALPHPLLITHGTADTLIPLELNQQEFKRRCARGDQVQMVQLTGIGHDAREESAALTLTWLQQRWLGQPMDTSCVINTQG